MRRERASFPNQEKAGKDRRLVRFEVLQLNATSQFIGIRKTLISCGLLWAA